MAVEEAEERGGIFARMETCFESREKSAEEEDGSERDGAGAVEEEVEPGIELSEFAPPGIGDQGFGEIARREQENEQHDDEEEETAAALAAARADVEI